MNMRVVFMGTPQYASIILEGLAQKHQVVAVYTRADAVRGRGKQLVATPVKEVALTLGIPVYTPDNFKLAEDVERLRSLHPDVIVVAAYGVILPQSVLDIPRYGCLNSHASLLPEKRGAAPIERGILDGDPYLGVCVMRMEAGMDTGPFAFVKRLPNKDIGALEATEQLANLGCQGMLEALEVLETCPEGVLWTTQDETRATYAPKITSEDLILDPTAPVQTNLARVRASSAVHPAKCCIATKRCSVMAAQFRDAKEGLPAFAEMLGPGHVAYVNKRLLLGCADGVLEVLRLKPDGKREMDASAFACGIRDINQSTTMWEK